MVSIRHYDKSKKTINHIYGRTDFVALPNTLELDLKFNSICTPIIFFTRWAASRLAVL